MSLAIKRPERTISICLNGSLVAEHEEATRKLDAAYEARMLSKVQAPVKDDRLGKKKQADPVAEAAAEVDRIYKLSQAETVEFTLRGLPRHKWDELVAAHPPREDNDLDEAYGFNPESLPDALLASTEPATIVGVKDANGKPIEFTPKDWPEFSEGLTNAQHEQFAVAAINVNRKVESVPFSLAARREMGNTDAS